MDMPIIFSNEMARFSTQTFYWICVILLFNCNFLIDLKQSVFSELQIKTFIHLV